MPSRISATPPLRLSSVPLLPVLIVMIVTIAVCGLVEGSLAFYFIPFICIIVAMASRLWQRRFGPFAVMAVVGVVGWLTCELNFPQKPASELMGEKGRFSGYVKERVEGERSLNGVVRVDSWYNPINHKMEPVNPFFCYVVNPTRQPDFNPGDRVTFETEIKEFISTADVPFEQDFPAYQWRKGIRVLGVVIEKGVMVSREENLPLTVGIWKIKHKFATNVESHLKQAGLDHETTMFFTTLMTGSSPTGFSGLRSEFSAVGLSHILAVSGMHVGILIGLIGIALLPMALLDRRRLVRGIITVVVIWLYAVATGLSPSVVRSVVMATIIIIAGLIHRTSSTLNNLCLAGILILTFDPLALWSPGFQLSFLAVAAIITLVPMHQLSRSRTGRMSSGAITTIAAVAGTGVVSAYYFHTFPVYFLIANIPVLTLLPWIAGGGVVLLLGTVAGIELSWLAELLNQSLNWITWFVKWVGSLPGSIVENIYLSGWLLIPYFCALIFTALSVIKRTKRLLCTSACLWTVFVIFIILNSSKSNEYIWTIQRDRQSTNIIIRMPGRFIMTGTEERRGRERDDIAKAYLRYDNYLKCNGIDSIEIVKAGYRDSMMLRTKDELFIGSKSIVLLNRRDYTVTKSGVDYMIVCKGFRGDVLKAVNDYRPEKIVFSLDVGPKQLEKMTDELSKLGITYQRMQDGPLSEKIQ